MDGSNLEILLPGFFFQKLSLGQLSPFFEKLHLLEPSSNFSDLHPIDWLLGVDSMSQLLDGYIESGLVSEVYPLILVVDEGLISLAHQDTPEGQF